jgi:hypothetical protein
MSPESEVPLPGFDKVPVVQRRRVESQPRELWKKMLTREEILFGTFDKPFRSQLRWNIHELTRIERFELPEVLTDRQMKLLYLSLQGQSRQDETALHWMKESEIMAEMNGDPKEDGFREMLNWTLARIWRRAVYGPRALEILKFTDDVYRMIVKGPYKTVDELHDVEAEQLVLLCGTRNTLTIFESHMQQVFPQYQTPAVTFVSELPPDQAAKKSWETKR